MYYGGQVYLFVHGSLLGIEIRGGSLVIWSLDHAAEVAQVVD